mgnify:CR=1 FL=1
MLVDWLIDVGEQLKLKFPTVFQAVVLLDHFDGLTRQLESLDSVADVD